jgi:hypothetical protein
MHLARSRRKVNVWKQDRSGRSLCSSSQHGPTNVRRTHVDMPRTPATKLAQTPPEATTRPKQSTSARHGRTQARHGSPSRPQPCTEADSGISRARAARPTSPTLTADDLHPRATARDRAAVKLRAPEQGWARRWSTGRDLASEQPFAVPPSTRRHAASRSRSHRQRRGAPLNRRRSTPSRVPRRRRTSGSLAAGRMAPVTRSYRRDDLGRSAAKRSKQCRFADRRLGG